MGHQCRLCRLHCLARLACLALFCLDCLNCLGCSTHLFLSTRHMQIYDTALRVGTQFRRRHFATYISFIYEVCTLYAHPEMRFDSCVGAAAFQVYRRQSISLSVAALRNLPRHLFVFPPASQRGRCPGLASGASQAQRAKRAEKAQAGALPPVAQSARSVPVLFWAPGHLQEKKVRRTAFHSSLCSLFFWSSNERPGTCKRPAVGMLGQRACIHMT